MQKYAPQITWLLSGDPCIQYLTHKDLLDQLKPQYQRNAAAQGWARIYLDAQGSNGHWGMGFYQPKWISTHYSLLDLRNMGIPSDQAQVSKALKLVLTESKSEDGGINPARTIAQSDVCVNGMFLRYACYFQAPAQDLHSVIDFVLSQQMPDGGFNCMLNRSGARHSSLHSTLSVLEGLAEYTQRGYGYRLKDVQKVLRESEEFILLHRFYKSDHSGEIIKKSFLQFTHPSGWYYNILRALEYFADNQRAYDPRMKDALEYLISKQSSDGRWRLNAYPAGQYHVKMERAGQPSRWITLKALKVLRAYETSLFPDKNTE